MSSNNSSAASSDVAAVTTVPAVPVFDATRHDDHVSRSYVRGHNCPDVDDCPAVVTPTVTTAPTQPPKAKVVVKTKAKHTPVHHRSVKQVHRTTKGKTSSQSHTTQHKSGHSSKPVSSGGGSGCAPSVRLPGNVVRIVHKHLSGCKAAALLWIIKHESGGNVHATNRSSGAYGLPQALPGRKMASCGSDWRTNADTQVRWMIGYTKKYGGPVGAYHFWVKHHWY